MLLRDLFAMNAMKGMLVSSKGARLPDYTGNELRQVAKLSYQMADIMEEERKTEYPSLYKNKKRIKGKE